MNRISSCLKNILILLSIISFHHLQGDWTPPVTLSGTPAANATVAVDASGNAVAVWQETIGPNTLIRASTLPFGGTWTSPVSISAAGTNAATPDVAVDPAGDAVAVWQFDSTNKIIQGARLPFRGVWTTPDNISVTGDDAFDPHVAVDPSGNAIAVWYRFNGSNDIIQSASLPFAPFPGTWSTPVNVSLAGDDATEPEVAVDANGNAVAVWKRFNGTNFLIQAANKLFTSPTWTTPTSISVAGQDSNNPQLAVDNEGDAAFVFTRFNGVNSIVQGVVQPFFDTYSGPTNISILQQNSSNPSIALNPVGNGVAVWASFNGTNTIIQSSTISSANLTQEKSVWTAPVNVSAPGANATLPIVSMDSAGNAIAIWSRSNIIQSAALPVGSTWSEPIDVSSPGADGENPIVVSDPAGNAVAVWEETIGSGTFVQASTNFQFFRPEPPVDLTGFVTVDRFLTQKDIVNHIQWFPSPDIRVVSYNVYRNGTLISNIPATNTKLFYDDHDRNKKMPDVYTVTSVLKTGLESLPATIILP